jgi:hypothetical protein
MKIFDSPASTILVTNSEGAKYDIADPLVEAKMEKTSASEAMSCRKLFAAIRAGHAGRIGSQCTQAANQFGLSDLWDGSLR